MTALYTAAVNQLRVNNVINNSPAGLPVRSGYLPGLRPDPSLACSNPASLNVGEMEMLNKVPQLPSAAMLSCLSCDGVCVCVCMCVCVCVCACPSHRCMWFCSPYR